MTRYSVQIGGNRSGKTATRADRWEFDALVPDIHVPEAVAVNTGLVDARGHSIMRHPLPVGFGRMEDW